MSVYLDYNATTPVDIEVQETICSVIKNVWGNPSSSYDLGKTAKSIVENARGKVAQMINSLSSEVIFTSGGTECNNMVISTAIQYYHIKAQNFTNGLKDIKPHIITTNIEHDSVKLPLEKLSEEGKIDVTFVPVSKITGAVDIDDIINSVRPNTCLITVMLANNETGIIQPISILRSKLKAIKDNKFQGEHSLNSILLHTDAAQAIGKIEVDVQDLDVDYLTIVGHKFYGPRIGALYFKSGVPLFPIFYGGGQERNYRPGTENTCMIAGLGKAAEMVSFNLKEYNKHMTAMSHHLKKCLETTFPKHCIFHIKDNNNKLPNTVSVALDYDKITGSLLLSEAKNVCASTGAACHSGGKPSSILLASGIPCELASKTLRLSVGRETTEKEIEVAVAYLDAALKNLGIK
ncbi:Selenocysteine lyase like protein [Argiope bruennichi]|uniref:Selenocysteine lyase n=1 Tax=Argiope bruennichi TaxID=94029 RepID=A0A8T0E0N7_ARGBR|nr:Selenocysteine lyase like protein [Argiope bruennichi]